MINRINNLLVLFVCLAYALIRGKAKQIKDLQKGNILISQEAKLGDMVCTTPMFRAIKKFYPESKLSVLGNSLNREVVKYNPDIDNYIESRQSIWSLSKDLREIKFDFAAIASPDFVALAACFLAGIPMIIVPKVENGWSPYETKIYKILRLLAVTRPHIMGNYAPREYLRLLEVIGINTDDTKKYVFSSNEAKDSVIKFLDDNKVNSNTDFIVAISPSAGNKIKEWDPGRFAKVADYIHEKYKAVVVIIGASNDKELADSLISQLNKSTKYVNACGRFSIDELKAFMEYADVFISVDTGPIYIAEACGVATIDIIGPMNEFEQPPRGPINRVVVDPKRSRPVLSIMNARIYDYNEARSSIEGTTVEMVTTEFDSLYKQINP